MQEFTILSSEGKEWCTANLYKGKKQKVACSFKQGLLLGYKEGRSLGCLAVEQVLEKFVF